MKIEDIEKYEGAKSPEDLTRLFVERANAGDAAGIAALYEEGAVMAYPPGAMTIGRAAIRSLWEKVLANAPHFEQEPPLPTLVSGDLRGVIGAHGGSRSNNFAAWPNDYTVDGDQMLWTYKTGMATTTYRFTAGKLTQALKP